MDQQQADHMHEIAVEVNKWATAFNEGAEAIQKMSIEYLRQRDEAQNLSLELYRLREKFDAAVASLKQANPKICLNCYERDAVTPAGPYQCCSACIPF